MQISGMISSSYIWKKVLTRYSYKGMMKISIALLTTIPLLSLLINSIGYFYALFFVIGGAVASWKIIQEGAIIEIAKEENRALYLGVFGSLNLSSMIAPIVIGALLHNVDISYIFIVSSLFSAFSFLLIKKIVCPVDLNY
ncbi:MFS transporter [Melioribacter sp. Ez-97]|uniref:MFS transporter n=1 Tax=Melioribacter sp. Ez-97 TaxID=3423434 RepID=UPI003EDA313B